MAHMNLQASQSSIGEPHGSFDLQSNEGVSIQFSGDPDPISDQSQGAPTHQAPPNMNFHPANMGNIAHPMHILQQMQPMQAFQHPIMNPSLQMSDDDIVRIVTKMNELLGDRIEKLVKTQVEAVIVPMREELNKTQSDLAKVQKQLKKVIVKTDDLEQYSRRSCLRIAGIKETGNEDVTKKVLDLAQSVAAPITLQDIDRAHRVGKSRDDFPDPEEDISDGAREPRSREIIVKFTNTSARLHMLKGRAVLRERNAHTYINEDLTKKVEIWRLKVAS